MASLEEYLAALQGPESGGNLTIRNPQSQAEGLYQIMPATQAGLRRQGFNLDMSTAEGQTAAAAELTRQNDALLRHRLNRDPTDAERYFAHGFGGPAASYLLAHPEMPLEVGLRTFYGGTRLGEQFADRIFAQNPNLQALRSRPVTEAVADYGNRLHTTSRRQFASAAPPTQTAEVPPIRLSGAAPGSGSLDMTVSDTGASDYDPTVSPMPVLRAQGGEQLAQITPADVPAPAPAPAARPPGPIVPPGPRPRPTAIPPAPPPLPTDTSVLPTGPRPPAYGTPAYRLAEAERRLAEARTPGDVIRYRAELEQIRDEMTAESRALLQDTGARTWAQMQRDAQRRAAERRGAPPPALPSEGVAASGPGPGDPAPPAPPPPPPPAPDPGTQAPAVPNISIPPMPDVPAPDYTRLYALMERLANPTRAPRESSSERGMQDFLAGLGAGGASRGHTVAEVLGAAGGGAATSRSARGQEERAAAERYDQALQEGTGRAATLGATIAGQQQQGALTRAEMAQRAQQFSATTAIQLYRAQLAQQIANIRLADARRRGLQGEPLGSTAQQAIIESFVGRYGGVADERGRRERPDWNEFVRTAEGQRQRRQYALDAMQRDPAGRQLWEQYRGALSSRVQPGTATLQGLDQEE